LKNIFACWEICRSRWLSTAQNAQGRPASCSPGFQSFFLRSGSCIRFALAVNVKTMAAGFLAATSAKEVPKKNCMKIKMFVCTIRTLKMYIQSDIHIALYSCTLYCKRFPRVSCKYCSNIFIEVLSVCTTKARGDGVERGAGRSKSLLYCGGGVALYNFNVKLLQSYFRGAGEKQMHWAQIHKSQRGVCAIICKKKEKQKI